jgi:3-hydroxybutyrate dehydrogenase
VGVDSIFRLDGRAALVTGGGSGIGLEVCRALTKAGAAVTIADIDGERAKAVAHELPGARARQLDATGEAQGDAVIGALDRIDILVNNACIGLVGGIEETAAEGFRRRCASTWRACF